MLYGDKISLQIGDWNISKSSPTIKATLGHSMFFFHFLINRTNLKSEHPQGLLMCDRGVLLLHSPDQLEGNAGSPPIPVSKAHTLYYPL